MAAHKIAVIAGDGIGKEVMPEGIRALEAAAAEIRHRVPMGRVAVELRLLREARADDARGLVRADPRARCHLLRRRRLAGDGARSHFAVGVADPVAARLRPIRQHAAVPPDAGHPVAARQPQARRHRFRRRAREHRRRIFIGRRPRVRRNRARDGVPADHLHTHGRRPHHEVRVRTCAKTRKEKHVTSATKSNGISITMPYWDERFREMAARYPGIRTDQYHIDILTAHFVQRPERFDVVVGSNLFGDILSDLGPAVCGTIGIAPSANINPERKFPSTFEPVHGSAPDIAGKGSPIRSDRSGRGR